MLVSYTASTRRASMALPGFYEIGTSLRKTTLVLLVALVGPLLVLVEGVELLGAF